MSEIDTLEALAIIVSDPTTAADSPDWVDDDYDDEDGDEDDNELDNLQARTLD